MIPLTSQKPNGPMVFVGPFSAKQSTHSCKCNDFHCITQVSLGSSLRILWIISQSVRCMQADLPFKTRRSSTPTNQTSTARSALGSSHWPLNSVAATLEAWMDYDWNDRGGTLAPIESLTTTKIAKKILKTANNFWKVENASHRLIDHIRFLD